MKVLTDKELLAAFEAGVLSNEEFPHARHVRVAWLLARKYGRGDGLERLCDGIRGIARRAGRPDAFHTTITKAWFELIASVDDVDEHAELLDKALLERFYSPARLGAGRDCWLEPDLHPLRLPPPEPFAADVAAAIRYLPTAVAVIAGRVEGTVHAATVSWLTCVSRDPALVAVSVARGSRTLEVLGRADAFTISVLASEQKETAVRFADRGRSPGTAQFGETPHHMTPHGPILDDAVVTLGCELRARHACGDHELLVGAVRSARARPDLHPLVQHNGGYR
jgi:flavin reductase (DIM6/NTAB) family NADH-FMN oxidoreductase RutF